MLPSPAFPSDARLGRLSLFLGAYSPAAIVVGLRIGFCPGGLAVAGLGVAGIVAWISAISFFVDRRSQWNVVVGRAEPIDRDVTAYVATYLLPTLAAAPQGVNEYLGYGVAASLLAIVAFRADLAAVNPLAYVLGYRVYRVYDGATQHVVLSQLALVDGSACVVRSVAGLTKVTSITPDSANDQEDPE